MKLQPVLILLETVLVLVARCLHTDLLEVMDVSVEFNCRKISVIINLSEEWVVID